MCNFASKMRTNKIIIFLPLFLAMMLGVTGCNSEDSEDVTAIYHVLDKNGHEASVFNYGDEILFELIVMNSSNHPLKFEDWRMLQRDACVVYDSDGQLYNPIPNDNLMTYPVTIEPGKPYFCQLIWPWDRVPLPIGKYYSTYTLNVDKIYKTYTINFEIK